MRRFRLSPLAKRDLGEIRHYIHQDKPVAAGKQIAKFFQTFTTLGRNPEMGQQRPEFGLDIRVFSIANYMIVYRPFTEGVEIIRVVSGCRDIEALFAGP